MAINLARSFKVWNDLEEIAFYIATDSDFPLPKDLSQIRLIRVPKGSLGAGFSAKLRLDQLAPADQTLFVDADCLCLGDLDRVFDAFSGRPVSVVGGQISQGEWFGDVASVCARFGVPNLPKFNGGIYYLEPGPKAAAVYERARGLEPDYDTIGLVRLRGQPNDELLMAIALAIEGCSAVHDDGSIMGDLLSCQAVPEINVISGRALLRNPPAPDPLHQPWFPLQEVRPLVVHFLGHHVEGWRYRTEALKLLLSGGFGISPFVANLMGVAYSTPSRVVEHLKAALRPLVHRYVGVRGVRASVR